MNTDFYDAHNRTYEDAESLYSSGRLATADHLYGIAAECGLKRLMLCFGMPFDAVRGMPSKSNDTKHIDAIWMRYESYRSGSSAGLGYNLPSPNPFDNWHASHRYANESNFNHALVDPHKNGAEVVKGLVKKATLEGLI